MNHPPSPSSLSVAGEGKEGVEMAEKRANYGWLWVFGLLAAAIGGLVVYARMKPETAVGKRVQGATVTLWEALRRGGRNGEQPEGPGEPEALPNESRWEA